jgi:hypothetical protein
MTQASPRPGTAEITAQCKNCKGDIAATYDVRSGTHFDWYHKNSGLEACNKWRASTKRDAISD